jgi:hypothetical protein
LWDTNFPIEEGLITTLIQSVIADVLGAAYRPKDINNNAQDDLSDLIAYVRKNMKSNMAKQMEGEDSE